MLSVFHHHTRRRLVLPHGARMASVMGLSLVTFIHSGHAQNAPSPAASAPAAPTSAYTGPAAAAPVTPETPANQTPEVAPTPAPRVENTPQSQSVEPLSVPLEASDAGTSGMTIPETDPSQQMYIPLSEDEAEESANLSEPLPKLEPEAATPDPTAIMPILPSPELEVAKYLELESVAGPFGLSGSYSGFQVGLILSAIYDTNIYQLSSEEKKVTEAAGTATSGMILTAGPVFGYRSPGPLWFVEFDYTPSFVSYLDNDALSGWDQNMLLRLRYERKYWRAMIETFYASNRAADQSLASLGQAAVQAANTGQQNNLDREGLAGEDIGFRFSASHTGPKLATSLNASVTTSSGGNRYYGANVEETFYNFSGRASYALSSRTSFDFSTNYSLRSPSAIDGSSAYQETTNTNTQLTAMWKISPLLRIGPGIRYTYDTRGDWDGGRSSLGPVVRSTYQLTRKVNLDGQISAEFVSIDSGAASATSSGDVESPYISGNLSANYAPSRLWSTSLSFSRAVRPESSSADAFQDTYFTRLSINRRIAAASIFSFGVGHESSDRIGGSSTISQKRKYLTVDGTLSFPLWKENVTGAVFCRYRDEQGNYGSGDWSGFQFGLRAVVTF